jgi:hypothetical protein
MVKQKIKYGYASGWWMKFDAHGAGPRLFLEWMANYQTENRPRLLNFKISIESDPEDILYDVFKVRIMHVIQDTFMSCVQYIRENS